MIEASVVLGSNATATQIISGLGGSGKSQLVAKYVADNRVSFDLVAWLDASTDIASQLAELARQVGLKGEPDELAQEMLVWLASTERTCLVVLDNVNDPVVFAGFKTTNTVRVIATTRLNNLSGYGRTLRLGTFTRDESIEYLQSRTTMRTDEAGRIGKALGDLPLALAHAGAYCSRNATTPADYLELLAGLPSQEHFKRNLDDFYRVVVHKTWNTSIQQVSPLGRQVLAMAAWLHSAGIPVDAFSELVPIESGHPDNQGWRKRRAAMALREAGGELVDLSLAEWTRSYELSVHRLVQHVVRDATIRSNARQMATDFVLRATQFNSDTRSAIATAESVAPHIDSLIANFRPRAIKEKMLCTAGNRCVEELWRGGRPTAAVSLGETVRGYTENAYGANHPNTLAALTGLASSYWSAGRISEAIPIEERIADWSEITLGADHPKTLKRRSSLATSYWSAGRTSEAIAIEQRVATQTEVSNGPDHPDTLQRWANLAVSYRSVGHVSEAIAIEERVTRQSEASNGPNHPDTLAMRSNLAVSYRMAGRNSEAIAILEEVSIMSDAIQGATHPHTLEMQTDLAVSYQVAGRNGEAIAILEEVTDHSESNLGIAHPLALVSRSHLAVSYRAAGRNDDAITMLEEVTDHAETELGKTHPFTSSSRAQLAVSQQRAGNTTAAIRLMRQAAAGLGLTPLGGLSTSARTWTFPLAQAASEGGPLLTSSSAPNSGDPRAGAHDA